jgi:hypothetical protein
MIPRICLAVLVSTVVLLSGCALRYYDVTLTNGTVIGAKSRPRLQNGYYFFTDFAGKEQRLPEHRISEIAPHVEKAKKSPFNNYGVQK